MQCGKDGMVEIASIPTTNRTCSCDRTRSAQNVVKVASRFVTQCRRIRHTSFRNATSWRVFLLQIHNILQKKCWSLILLICRIHANSHGGQNHLLFTWSAGCGCIKYFNVCLACQTRMIDQSTQKSTDEAPAPDYARWCPSCMRSSTDWQSHHLSLQEMRWLRINN